MSRLDEQLSAKVLKRVGQLRRLGARGFAHTAYVRALGPTLYSLADPCRSVARTFHRQQAARSTLGRRNALEARAEKEVRADAAPLLRDLDPKLESLLAKQRSAGRPQIIGELGPGGAIVSSVGPIRGVRCVEGESLGEPSRARPVLVDLDGRLGVRREFGADQLRFLRAIEALLDLAAAGCAVPRIVRVDWARNAITTEFVPGNPVRSCGEQRSEDRATADQLERALVAVHQAGYVLDRIDKDDVIWSDARSAPVLAGAHRAIPLAGVSRDMSVYLRDRDRERFNRLFGTRMLTAAELRKLPSPPGGARNGRPAPVYAPILVRDDIRWGKIWNTDVGIGRWNFIMKAHLPIPQGGRVLDLGSNNGFNPLQMLRSGAASAIGVEIDEFAIAQGEFLKSAFEWLDNRSYDFRYIHGSQADLPTFGLPGFDVVTALCSLYYLREREMRALVSYIRSLSDILVLQCNTDRLIDRSDEDTYRKASVPFALELLEAAGYGDRTVIAPPGYSRPLVIGRA